jgi:DNA polymerase alpha subunit A
MEEDFVVDDDGLGYADTGVEEWDQKHYYSDEDEPSGKETKTKKKSVVSSATSSKIQDMFRKSSVS